MHVPRARICDGNSSVRVISYASSAGPALIPAESRAKVTIALGALRVLRVWFRARRDHGGRMRRLRLPRLRACRAAHVSEPDWAPDGAPDGVRACSLGLQLRAGLLGRRGQNGAAFAMQELLRY